MCRRKQGCPKKLYFATQNEWELTSGIMPMRDLKEAVAKIAT